MEQKFSPKFIVTVSFLLAGGLIVVGLLYPKYLEMKSGNAQIIEEPIVTPLDP